MDVVTDIKKVKISKETYARLCEIAEELQMKLKRPISLDEAVMYLLTKGKMRASDFAGAWSMSDSEETEILKCLKEPRSLGNS